MIAQQYEMSDTELDGYCEAASVRAVIECLREAIEMTYLSMQRKVLNTKSVSSKQFHQILCHAPLIRFP